MHLLLIHQNFPGQFRDLGPAWLAAGHRITAVGHADEGPDWPGLRYLRYSFTDPAEPTPLQRAQAVENSCAWLLQHDPPDLALVHSGWGEALFLRRALPSIPIVVYPELWGTPASLGLGIDPVLASPADLPGLEPLLERQNLLAELAIVQADAAVVPSDSQWASFPAALQARLQVIPEGVDLERLGPDPAARFRTDTGLALRAGDPVVTLVSRQLEPLRGLRAALQAWPQVLRGCPEAQLVLVGGEDVGYGIEPPRGPSHLADALEGLPLEQIHVLPPLPYAQMIRLLQCSACHLGLSYPYTLSWSHLEAMACGAPLIANPESPLAPHLTAGENALLAPLADPAALANAIVSLLHQPALGQRLGHAGRQLIADQFNLTQALERYASLFQRLLSASSSSGQSELQSPGRR
jgi:glycosyltransferase involved in cell wall biosynthesis